VGMICKMGDETPAAHPLELRQALVVMAALRLVKLNFVRVALAAAEAKGDGVVRFDCARCLPCGGGAELVDGEELVVGEDDVVAGDLRVALDGLDDDGAMAAIG
jgi:hypothetical protein